MANQDSKNIITGTWIMAFAAIFSKILSAVYRVPLQNMVGDHGYYIYQQIYSIYGIFSVLSLTGLPLLISKLFSSSSEEELNRYILDVFWILVYIAIFLVVVIQISSSKLSLMMGDKNIKEELQLTAFIYLLMPFETVIRGYYQSKLNVGISAISQVIEQFIRVTLILLVAFLFTAGLFDVYKMGAWANFGSVIAAIVASLYLGIVFLKDKPIKYNLMPTFNKKIFKLLVTQGLGIVLVTGILVFFQMIDSLTIVPELIKSGLTVMQAGVQKGIFDRAQPLAQLGIVVVISFLSVLVPAKQANIDQSSLNKVLRFCINLSLAETVGLCLLIRPINTMLFKDDKESMTIAIFLISIALYSLINILVTLNDKTHHKLVLIFIGISLTLKAILNIILIQHLGLIGASIATNISLLCLLILLLFISDKKIKRVFTSDKFIGKTLIALLVMAVFVEITVRISLSLLGSSRTDSIIITFLSILVGVIVYGISVVKFKVFPKEDLNDIPILKRIIK